MSQIITICREHTNLTDNDIHIISQVGAQLQIIADLAQANVFIDCPTKDEKHAVVVAEASPRTGPSLYTRSVVGRYAYASYEPAVIRTHQTGKPTFNRGIMQEGKMVKQSVVPIMNDSGKTIGSLIMEQDISAQLKHENELKMLYRTTEQLSETLIGLTEQESFISDMLQEALIVVDHRGRIAYANAYAINLIAEFGGMGEVNGTPIKQRLRFLQDIEFKDEHVLFEEMDVDRKTFAIKIIPLKREKKRMGHLLLIRDLTELREKERQLMVKSTVIKEIHHRVKNNLQAVASLLRLQMRRGVPDEVKHLFQESLNRILTIASVHEVLSTTRLDVVNILQMVKKIGQMLVQNSDWLEKDIRISFSGHKVKLSSDKAVSLALVVNELIQNSVEHAFAGRNRGEIFVDVERDNERVTVRVTDDGIGYSQFTDTDSLGMQIVKTLTEHDLSGTFSISSHRGGTVAVVEFPIEEVGVGVSAENTFGGR